MDDAPESRTLAWTRRIWNQKVPLRFLLFCLLVALAPILYSWLKPQYKEIVDPTELGKEGLGVHDLITQIKSELQQTDDERRKRGEAALFQVKDFDLEVNFFIHRHVSAKGEISYQLVAVSGETQSAFERTQKITLHLTAVPPEPIQGVPTPSIKMDDSSHISVENPPPPRERRKP